MDFTVCDLCAGVGELLIQTPTGSFEQFDGMVRYENCTRCSGTGRDPGLFIPKRGPKARFGLDTAMQAAVDVVEAAKIIPTKKELKS